MYNISKLKLFFIKNSQITEEIKTYINESFDNNELKQVNSNSTPLIFKFKITEKINKNVVIKSEYFFYILFEYLRERFQYDEIDNYKIFMDYIKKSKKEIYKLKDSISIWLGFKKFLFVYFNQIKKWDFKEYILKINVKSKSDAYFNIQHTFANALPYLNISKENLTDILYHFFRQSNQDLMFVEVNESVRKYSYNQPKNGWALVNYLIKVNKKEFIIPILKGLSSFEFDKTFDFTEQLLHKKGFESISLQAFGAFEYKYKKDIKNIIKLIKSIDSDNKYILASLSSTCSRLVYFNSILRDVDVEYLLKKIEALAQKLIPEVQYSILNFFFQGDKHIYKEQKMKLIMIFSKIDMKYQGIINLLRPALVNLEEPKIVLEFIEKWVLNHPYDRETDTFLYPLKDTYNRNPSEFIKNYISLLIHDKGIVRYYANNISDFIKLSDKNKKIWKDNLCKLNEVEAKKFIYSILNDDINHEERMKLTLLLLKKRDTSLFKYILQHFVLLIQDYRGTVKKIVETSLNYNNSFEKKFIDEFLKYYNQVVDFWHEKNKINEFNPYESQAIYAVKFQELTFKAKGEDIIKSTQEQSVLLKLVKKVPIGRGRKYKTGTTNQYSEMKTIITSFLIPRTYLVYPELYEFKRKQNLLNDW